MITCDKVNVIYGRDAVKKGRDLIRSLGEKFLIITGKSSAKLSGALDDLLSVIEGKEYVIYDGIGENPKVSSVLEAAGMLDGVDCVAGIGGGSPLDAAKVVACLKSNPADSEEELYAQKWENEGLPLILIGTTAGTGSEVTQVSVLSKNSGKKSSIHNQRFYAKYAFCDPHYTYSMPLKTAVSTAVDALTHCNESYFSNKATDESRGYALKGISLLLPGLLSYGNGFRDEWKDDIYLGSLYGGLAIDITGTTFAHNVGYYLTEEHHLPHGFACAVFQRDLFEFEMENNREYAEAFFEKIGMDQDAYADLIDSFLPENDIVIDEETLNNILPRWKDNGSVKNTYGKMSVDDIEKILRKKFSAQSE